MFPVFVLFLFTHSWYAAETGAIRRGVPRRVRDGTPLGLGVKSSPGIVPRTVRRQTAERQLAEAKSPVMAHGTRDDVPHTNRNTTQETASAYLE